MTLHLKNDTCGVEVMAEDQDGDEVSLSYEWMLNDAYAGSKNKLDVAVKRGDVIVLKITPSDGTVNGVTAEMKRIVPNMHPQIIKHQDAFFDGNLYTYQIKAEDPDGDTLNYVLHTDLEGMTVSTTGLLTWNVPEAFTGVADALVIVEDGQGGATKYDLKITIKAEESETS